MGSEALNGALPLGTKRKYDGAGHVKKETEEEDLHIWGTNRFRKVPPTDYVLKIESFSLLLESGMERFDTQYFESGGNKWKLSLHPGKKADVGGHISLSLAIEQPSASTPSWEVNVNVKFFVLDQIRGQYLMIPDAYGQERRFDWLKLEWCFPNLMSHDTFNDPSKGYLVNDCCVFGVELLGNTRQVETFSRVKQSGNLIRNWSGGGLFSWKIDNFSTINTYSLDSPVFTVGGKQWKLRFFPKGEGRSDGKHLSITFLLVNGTPVGDISAHYWLRLKDQISDNHIAYQVDAVFGKSKKYGSAHPNYMLFDDLKAAGSGYIVNDSIVIEAELSQISTA
ncbi:hypothetical protein Tsubulata_045899 [Turnera subulata]|uniref:MATH domain-containing protein n=1 Tax=Turnera subulata TaxID=218843 RepID=A0A9Q0FGH0_9ROSI|nr:hypothetical protein Tsubulata_045899 [Turnera subulata]